MKKFVETEKMLKKKFGSQQEKLGRNKGFLIDDMTWLQQGESMLRHTSSFKGVLMSRQRSSCRDIGIR